jgi:hypothetical protein
MSRSKTFRRWVMGTVGGGLGALVTLGFLAPALSAQSEGGEPAVTFTRDVAPILQNSCQMCHQPTGNGPMPLLTYEQARLYAPLIKQKVASKSMPPWHMDRTVGIQGFKNDISLSDEEISTIVRWVDDGAPLGDPADMPPAVVWPDAREWQLESRYGRPPDLVIRTTPFTILANGLDQWWTPRVPVEGLDAPRWIMANETKPAYPLGKRVVHHGNAALVRGEDTSGFANYGIGKPFDIYPSDTGRMIQPGDEVAFNLHYYPIGEEVRDDVVELGLWFYPEGEEPRFETAGDRTFSSMRVVDGRPQEMVIPPQSHQITQGIHVLKSAARIHSVRAHQHLIGTGQSIEAVYPDGRVEILGKVGWEPAWHITYLYEDHLQPLLPKGTVLIVTAWYDNTDRNPHNPDPESWVVYGRRTGDEMSHMWIGITYLDDEEYGYLKVDRERVLKEMAEQDNVIAP